MNTKRIASFVVVALLLAALPGMTAVLAQGQDPAVPGVIMQGDPETGLPILGTGGSKDLPVITEPGESEALTAWNRYEREPNNTRQAATRIYFNDVVGGKIDVAGDVDYYRFDLPAGHFLIDIEAQSIGSSLDSVVCVYDDWDQLSCNDDANESLDSLLFYNQGNSTIYVKVTEFHIERGGNNYNYELILSRPLLISATTGGTVAGIPFQAADILAHSDLNTGAQKWLLFFDASDVGIAANVSNLATAFGPAATATDSIDIGFSANQRLTEVGTVTPWDIVWFDPVRYGSQTSGRFLWGLRGKEVGLTASGEKIDALMMSGYMRQISTVGQAAVIGANGAQVTAKDEDIIGLDYVFGDPWTKLFVGSRVTGLAAEDIVAADDFDGRTYLTILGSGTIAGRSVNQKDIFAISPNYSWHSLAWRGSQHGWNYNIDAFEWGQ